MDPQADPLSRPDPTAPLSAAEADWARPLIERQLVMLSLLGEAALRVALTIADQITGAAEPVLSNAPGGIEGGVQGAPSPEEDAAAEAADAAAALNDNAPTVVTRDPALAFYRVSRAMRMAVALQAKLIEQRQESERQAASDAARSAHRGSADRLAVEQARQVRADRIERIVARVASVDHEADDATIDRVANEACERLEDDDLYDVLAWPVSETIARICRDLGLSPDWPRLAEEAWALEELAAGPVGAPLAAFAPPSSFDRLRMRATEVPPDPDDPHPHPDPHPDPHPEPVEGRGSEPAPGSNASPPWPPPQKPPRPKPH